jgi:VanZ family protein
MLVLRYRRYWIAVNILLVVAVFVLTVLPAILAPHRISQLPGIDKWLHALTFAALAIWFTGQYARRSYWIVAVGLIAYGALIEIGQSLIPYRTAEWGDLAADVAGIAAGIAIALVATGGWSQKAEQWFVDYIGRSLRNE